MNPCNGIPLASLSKRLSVVAVTRVYLWLFVFHLFSSALGFTSFCSVHDLQFIFAFFSLIHMYLPHYAFPIHLIKIRQNEKCDMSIYFSVSNIGYCSVAVCLCVCDVLSYMLQIICDAWVQKRDKAYVHADAQCSMLVRCMGMCLLCEAYAIHFGILFNFNSTVNWLLVYSFDLRDQNVDFVSKIVCVCE